MCKISIIVPVFNAEVYIERCIKSILNQTYSNFELLLIDDGSTDNSLSIIRLYELKDKRVRVFSKKNTGVSDTRNYGFSKSVGTYIVFVDSDDFLDCDYLMHGIQLFEKYKVDIVSFNFYFTDNKKNIKHKKYKEGRYDNIFSLNPNYSNYYTSIWGKIFKRNILKNIKFDDNIYYSEDTLFYTKALLSATYIYFSNEYMYYYYFNPNSAINKRNYEKFRTDFLARDEIYKLYLFNKLDYNYISYANNYRIMSCVNIIYDNINYLNCCSEEIGIFLEIFDKKIFFVKYFDIKSKLKLLYVICILKWRGK